ncbi:NifB/NifX family molybdenum-iron cluster-binding protein [Anaerocolumna sp. AGMB13025]|uniref:NifB/NifX family molybdenum-iron cluster-binding protein n=1 Tax=Anaerocolumna sp. AGMB13025 TaxID=3039116 RepID=UPI00241F2C8B|nr:NifB/NifX family molybdenum-iron cluster-binding protein [Anaerocolumna sp. AGMB13025]WFR54774.1 NifB/NifX family molybdenum-iron cluster-binding protein [Anaerocolumna sp. AGMB13025]
MVYRVAIGSRDGITITEHFGQCSRFYLADISQEEDTVTLVGERITDSNVSWGNHQEERIREKIKALGDCQIVLVKQIGGQSEKLLNHYGIISLQYSGLIEEALNKVKKYYKNQILVKEEQLHGQSD